MPTPRELLSAQSRVIAGLKREVEALSARVAALEGADSDWDTPMVDTPTHAFESALKGAFAPELDAKPWVSSADAKAYTQDEDGNTTFAAPTPMQRRMREALAKQIEWEHWTYAKEADATPLGDDAATRAYVEGGPFWFYGYDPVFVMQQPPHIRACMVKDAQLTHEQAAQELAATLLKDQGPGDQSIAEDAAKSDWDR